MSVTFTKEQQQVIDLRNRNLLVSAAAGSGKTAVLVERIIARLTRDENPLNVDELLIVTFTDAAAAEMKERIHKAIEDALLKNPENVHLQRQATLIHQAQITTIHRFCLSVIRDYFYTIDLDPGYRVAEEGEVKLLKQDVVKNVLENAYSTAGPEFVNFVESFASGKDDTDLEQLILKLAELAKKYPNPTAWLDACVDKYDLDKHDYLDMIMTESRRYLEEMEELLEVALGLCKEPDGPAAYTDAISSDLMQIQNMRQCDSFAALQSAMKKMNWQGLGRNKKGVDPEKAEQVKELRNWVKKVVGDLSECYFFEELDVIKKDMKMAQKHVELLVGLVKTYACAFAEEKRNKNLIDFDDMEHFALQILTREEDGIFIPSEVAEYYQQKFAEVMIDEYQDSNLVQEAILTSVSGISKGNYNLFMVGDVKQSIYRFRISRPELFMEKYHTYSLSESNEQRIDLHKNFRSRREVLDSANFVFEQIMTENFGGIAYDESAALYVGADYEEKEGNETEVLLLDAPKQNAAERAELEAEMIAERIQELMETMTVADKANGGYRSLRYSDIVVLSRSVKGWEDTIAEVFKRNGIPVYTGPKTGYFETPEIQLVLNYLRALDNPRQDIPFTAVLSSVFGGFTTEELAIIRSDSTQKTMYESVCSFAESGTDEEIRSHLQEFLHHFEYFRGKVSYMAIHELLWLLLNETGYLDYASALPGGEQRTANLEMLVEKAVAYEGTSYKGLFNFVRYIEQIQKYNEDFGEANILDEKADNVYVMTIHKSKGLEFPVVFVAGIGKEFNQQDVRQNLVAHPELGIGIDAIDPQMRMKTPTLLKKVIQQKVQDESVAEELRILYVAMTRAKEKLILTGATSKLEKERARFVALHSHMQKELPYYMIAKAKKYMDWILAVTFRETEEMPLKVREVTVEELAEREVEQVLQGRLTKDILIGWDTGKTYDAETKSQIEEQFMYEYPYDEGNAIKQKLSVSELKKRSYMDEEGDEVFREEEVIPLLPKFLQEEEELTGASRGTAYHKVLELLDFSKEYTEESLKQTILEMQESRKLSEEMAACIQVRDIFRFLQSSVGKRIAHASRRKKCFTEQPFVLGVEAKCVYPEVDSEDMILIQGIIDVYFEEDGELVVVDYKTDKVFRAEQLVKKYHAQLEYYAKALTRLTGKTVKEKIIYSFTLKREIEV